MNGEKSIREAIEEKKRANSEFAKQYEEYRLEHMLIAQLISARKEKGLSQSELADRINVSQQVVSRLETLSHSPNLSSLLKLADGLGMELKLVPKEQSREHSVHGRVSHQRSTRVTYAGALPGSHKSAKVFEQNQVPQEK